MEDNKLIYYYNRSKDRKNPILFQNNELKLDFFQLSSSYAKVYEEFYKKNGYKSDSLITALQEKSQNNPKNLTFEYSLSQITYNFKALVDYIWYHSHCYEPVAILQALNYDHLNDFKSIVLFL